VTERDLPEAARTEPSEPSEDGVDVTLIRWMLSLTPVERLLFLQDHVNAVLTVRALNADR
jgi:hypothetical protein